MCFPKKTSLGPRRNPRTELVATIWDYKGLNLVINANSKNYENAWFHYFRKNIRNLKRIMRVEVGGWGWRLKRYLAPSSLDMLAFSSAGGEGFDCKVRQRGVELPLLKAA